MGITKSSFDHFNRVIENFEKSTNEIDLLELGIQEAAEAMHFVYMRDSIANNFKSYVSLDLHNVPGVTQFDLSEHMPDAFSVDIITNFGTTEHVEYEEGQYNCWYNMHDWLKVGGIAMHQIPELGSWAGHCRYYSDFDFYRNLENYGYTIIELDNQSNHNGNLNWCVIQKTSEVPFMDYETFYKFMHIDSNVRLQSINPLNNPKQLM
jgi:hypothetical protein